MFSLHPWQLLLCRNYKNLIFFAVDNVELAANFYHLYIYYFCYFYKMLLKAISIIATGSHPYREIVKLFFVSVMTPEQSKNLHKIKSFCNQVLWGIILRTFCTMLNIL